MFLRQLSRTSGAQTQQRPCRVGSLGELEHLAPLLSQVRPNSGYVRTSPSLTPTRNNSVRTRTNQHTRQLPFWQKGTILPLIGAGSTAIRTLSTPKVAVNIIGGTTLKAQSTSFLEMPRHCLRKWWRSTSPLTRARHTRLRRNASQSRTLQAMCSRTAIFLVIVREPNSQSILEGLGDSGPELSMLLVTLLMGSKGGQTGMIMRLKLQSSRDRSIMLSTKTLALG
jgi:hypothetical protein